MNVKEIIPKGEEFSEVYRTYYPKVRAFFARRRYLAEEAEDLAQETFFRAYWNFHNYDRNRSLWSWLQTIMIRVWQDDLRKRATTKRQGYEVPFEESQEAHSLIRAQKEKSPQEELLETERLERLGACIEELPPKMRPVPDPSTARAGGQEDR